MILFEGTRAGEVHLAEAEATLFEAWRVYGRPRMRLDTWQASASPNGCEAAA